MSFGSFTPRFFTGIFNFLHLVDTRGKGADNTALKGTSYRVDSPGFESRKRLEIYSSSKPSILALRPIQPPIQWVLGFHPGGKADGALS
jgi:hypothetical protein